MLIGHQKQWNFLQKKIELNQLSHAYLFTGPEAIGKKTFAKEFVKLINCLSSQISLSESRTGEPCQKCVNCQIIERGNFPDFKTIGKKKGKSEIEIPQIREAQNFLSYKSYYGNFKAIVIDDAEKMNQEAQSCFLKSLEEPKGKTILFLITSSPDALLPTIVSRCQVMKFFRPKNLPPNAGKIEKEQKILEGLTGAINSSFSEKFKYVKALNLEERDFTEILQVLQGYLRYSLLERTGIGATKEEKIFFGKTLPEQNYPASRIKHAINLTEDISNKLVFTNANPKLALEVLLMEI